MYAGVCCVLAYGLVAKMRIIAWKMSLMVVANTKVKERRMVDRENMTDWMCSSNTTMSQQAHDHPEQQLAERLHHVRQPVQVAQLP